MSSENFIKLATVEEHANNYALPTSSTLVKGGLKINGTNTNVTDELLVISNATELVDGFESKEDKIKLDGIIGDINATPTTYVIRDADANVNTNGINFDLTPTSDIIPIGHIQWNPMFKTLSVGTADDSTLEIGQEIGFPIRNGTDEIIDNGKVVYWTNAIGASGRVNVAPFIADGSIVAERCLGVNTQELAKNEDGRSTWSGSIYGIDTTGFLYGETWISGDVLYASPTISGGMTKIKPLYPNIAIRLGIVINAHAIQGQIALKVLTYPLGEQVSISDVGNYYVETNTESVLQELGNKLSSAFEDLPPSPLISSKVGALSPTLTTMIGNIQQYTFGINEEMYGSTEVTHRYVNGQNLFPHVHWVTNGLDTTNRYVKWELEYSFANEDGVLSTPTTLSTEVLIPSNTISKTQYITDFATIIGTNVRVGAYLCWRLRRIVSVGTSPTSNPFGLAVGVHIYQNMLK